MNDREHNAALALVGGDGGEMRELSAGSLALLELAGNPLAEQMLGGETELHAKLADLMEFVWMHVAPRDEVVSVTVAGGSKAAALTWGLGLDAGKLSSYVQQIVSRQGTLRAVATTVEEEHGGSGPKNAPGHC